MNLDLGQFNYGADKPGPHQARNELSWRLDPEKSLSDYRIIITTSHEDTPQSKKTSSTTKKKSSKSGEVYHVHKSMLAIGPHNSLYFARLFLSETELSENASNTSSVELEPSAAKAFPKMLDFIYSSQKGKASGVTSQDAVPLRYLASYFGVEALFEEVNAFIRNDLKFTNAPIYVTEALTYNDEKILDAASVLCAQNVTEIAPETMAELPLKCFRDTLLSPSLQNQRQQNSDIISRHIAAFCRKHDEELDKDILLELTTKEVLPSIAHDEAFFLMSLSREYSLPTTPLDGSKTTLHERCINALSTNWESAVVPGINDKDVVAGDGLGYASLPVETKVELLEAVVKKSGTTASELLCMSCGSFTCGKTDGRCSSCSEYSRTCSFCNKRSCQWQDYSYDPNECPHCDQYN